MNIALIGYGKMGDAVERVAATRGISVIKFHTEANPLKHEPGLPKGKAKQKPKTSANEGVDVYIDFTQPSAVVTNVKAVAALGRNIVIGTTGWNAQLDEVKKIVRDAGIGAVYASNFSIGMVMFQKLVREASILFDPFEMYDVAVAEVHHKNKIDSPSGTAISIGNVILKHLKRKTEILGDASHGKIGPNQLHVSSTRLGNVVGEHSVTFDSAGDEIVLKHSAKNRDGFALGALLAAEWVVGRKGLFTFEDVLKSK